MRSADTTFSDLFPEATLHRSQAVADRLLIARGSFLCGPELRRHILVNGALRAVKFDIGSKYLRHLPNAIPAASTLPFQNHAQVREHPSLASAERLPDTLATTRCM